MGGSEALQVDVRVIAATNRNLEEMISAGTFREDLYYRLNVVMVEIPPLRLRRDDIPPTIELYLTRYTEEQQRKKMSFSKEAWNALLRYDYPGNVRELENIIQRAVILARGQTITLNELPAVVKDLVNEAPSLSDKRSHDLSGSVEQLEKELVFESLRLHAGNQSKAARDLGISRTKSPLQTEEVGVR